MNKIVLATALLALGSASAFAADLPERGMYAKVAANWSGLYVGGNVGWGWGRKSSAIETEDSTLPASPTLPILFDDKPQGVIGGAQIGYNYQMGALVTGLEADIQGSGIKGSAKVGLPTFPDTGPPPAGSSFSSSSELSWLGTLRGRIGFTMAPQLLLYGTGGLAFGQVRNASNTFFLARDQLPADVRETKVGWSAGAGAEWMFARNWSVKAEYLFVDLGNASATPNPTAPLEVSRVTTTWHHQDHMELSLLIAAFSFSDSSKPGLAPGFLSAQQWNKEESPRWPRRRVLLALAANPATAATACCAIARKNR